MRSPGLLARVLVAAATCAGCVSVHSVRRPASEGDLRAINAETWENPPARVEYIHPTGSAEPAPTLVTSLQSVDVAAVTARGVHGEPLMLEGGRVKSVRVVQHGWGALQGLAGGAAVGGLFGLAVGAADDSNGIVFSREQAMIFGVVIFGALGGLVGALIGGHLGRQTVYVFDDAR